MINSEFAKIEAIVLHKTGNKLNEEGIRFSKEPVRINELLEELLIKYFFSPFKQNEFYNLSHETDINLNEVYSYVSAIFDDPENLFEQSVNIAKHLYEQSVHPKIRGGELYVVYFKDCNIDGEPMDAVGIFKSETRETYLKIYPDGDGFGIDSDAGININKLDKGCLILNTEKEKGYLAAVVDNLSKGGEALYWIDDFLHLRARSDDYHNTQNAINFCKSFVVDHLPEEYEMSKIDQADMLNKSANFFKEKDYFDIEDFANEVIKAPELIEKFKSYKNQFEDERDMKISDEFEISDAAVKKQSRVLKSVIKLDKNFHIYVHGNRDMIENGTDEDNGMHYYKLFYKEEVS